MREDKVSTEERYEETSRRYKDRIRIFVILYVFGDTFDDPENPQRKKRFDTEMRLQKVDFLLRYPDYFAYELLKLAEEGKADRDEIKAIVRSILDKREPELRRHEMQRFFFGSYEDIDDVIAFLKSIDLVEFSSEKALDMKTINKTYFVTTHGVDRLGGMIEQLPLIGWYVERAELIKRYFRMKSAAELKRCQTTPPQSHISSLPPKPSRLHHHPARLWGRETGARGRTDFSTR